MIIPVGSAYLRKRVFEIIEIGAPEDYVSRTYDVFNMLSIINLAVSILYTFDSYRLAYGSIFLMIEEITVAFFAVPWTIFYGS